MFLLDSKMTDSEYVYPKYKHDSIPDSQILHPTEYTSKADYLITVINKAGEERYIPKDKDILKTNSRLLNCIMLYMFLFCINMHPIAFSVMLAILNPSLRS